MRRRPADPRRVLRAIKKEDEKRDARASWRDPLVSRYADRLRIPGSTLQVVGVDPGTKHTAVAAMHVTIGEGLEDACELVALEQFDSRDPYLFGRLEELTRGVRDFFERMPPHLIVLEAGFHNLNARTTDELAMARGALAFVRPPGAALALLPPASIRSHVTGGAVGKKEHWQAWAVEHHAGELGRLLPAAQMVSEDQADAIIASRAYRLALRPHDD